jgi:hypothetical protein
MLKATESCVLAALLELAQRFDAHCSSHLQADTQIEQYGRRNVKEALTLHAAILRKSIPTL